MVLIFFTIYAVRYQIYAPYILGQGQVSYQNLTIGRHLIFTAVYLFVGLDIYNHNIPFGILPGIVHN